MKWRLSVLVFLTGLYALTFCLPRQYHFISRTQTWTEAQTYCRERYTDLATVNDIEEMNRLVNTAQDATGGFTEMAWIGLHDNLSSWRWSLSDGSYYGDNNYNYRNWDFTQPDNFRGNQMCGKMWSRGIWEDSQCNLRHSFICYDGANKTGQRFILVEKTMSWSEAQRYCRGRYTDLASVRDKKENQEIKSLTKNRNVWIGLYRRREWSDQSDSKYRYWKQRQPDNLGGRQFCIAADLGNAGRWSDEKCNRQLAFVCYGDKKNAPDKPVLSTTTTTSTKVTPNKRTSTTTTSAEIITEDSSGDSPEKESTTGHVSTEITSPKVDRTSLTRPVTDETPNQSVLSTTANNINTTVTQNKRTTTDGPSTSTKITSPEQPSTTMLDKTTSNETPEKPVLSTTGSTVTQNKITTTDGPSTSSEITSSEQTSETPVLSTTTTSKEDPTSTDVTSKETPNNSILSTNPKTPNKRTTTEIKSTTDLGTSSWQPSTSEMNQTGPMTDQTPNQPVLSTKSTTMDQNKVTTSEGVLTSTGITSSEKPSATKLVQTTSNETPNKLILSTTKTTGVQNKMTTIKEDTTSTDVTSKETPNNSHLSITTETQNQRTSEIQSTTGHLRTSSGEPSTSEVDQTRPMTDETPNQPLLSSTTTTMTQNEITTTETDSTSVEISTSAQLSTPDLDQTSISGLTPNQPISTINTVTENKITTEGDATSTYFISYLPFSTPEQNQLTSIPVQTLYNSHYSTPTTVNSNHRTTGEVDSTMDHLRTVDQTRPITQHVIKLGVTLISKRQLSEDEIKDLVLVQFHNLLIEKGLPKSIKVGLKRPVK